MSSSNHEDDEKDTKPEVDDLAPMTFKTRKKVRPVTIEEDNGNIVKCTLRELDGKHRDRYFNHVSGRMKGLKGGGTVMGDSEGVQAHLISMCLFDDANKNVAKELIMSWPSSVQEALFQASQKLNGMGKNAEEDAKND